MASGNQDVEESRARRMKYTIAFLRGSEPPFRAVFKYKDEDGTWHQTTRKLKARKLKTAKQELQRVREQLEDEERRRALAAVKGAEDLTVRQYMAGYLDSLEGSGSIEKSTITAYRCIVKKIDDKLGYILLVDLMPEDIQGFERDLLHSGLSRSSVRKIHVLLKSALERAVESELLLRNPARAVRPPKLPPASPNALTEHQRARLMRFLDEAPDTPFNLAVTIALYTGMREGEICGLRWGDVDLEAGSLWVRRSVARDGTQTYIKTPKTSGSIRDVPLAPFLVRKMAMRLDAMRFERDIAGLGTDADDMAGLYVVGGIDGSWLAPHSVWRQWKALASSMGLVGTQGRTPTFHDLRHTFATYAIANGVDVKTVSSILGHANAAMTLNIYASADPNSKRAAAETIEKVMAKR